MTQLGLSRFNTAAILGAAGMVAGHWIQPAPGVLLWRRTLIFLALMALLGALRGWREASLREPRPSGRLTIWLAMGFAVGSVLLMALGYVAFHGLPS